MSFLIERINENTELLKEASHMVVPPSPSAEKQLPVVEKLKARMSQLINALHSDPSNVDMTKELDAIMNILELIDDDSENGPAAKAIRLKMSSLIDTIDSSSNGVEIEKVMSQLNSMIAQLKAKEKAAEAE